MEARSWTPVRLQFAKIFNRNTAAPAALYLTFDSLKEFHT